MKIIIALALVVLLCGCAWAQPMPPATPPSATSMGIQASQPTYSTKAPPASEGSTKMLEGGSSTLAMVDSVTVELRDNHDYAIINGNYPDACSHISSVEQVVQGSTIKITLLTNRPDDLMCATVLTPFTVAVLLTTGGLMPQEYSVIVNEGPPTTFTLEY
jgi:hypothetical protein